MGYWSLIGPVPHFLAFYFIFSLSHSFHPLTVFGQLSCCATSSFKSEASSLSDNSRMACALLFLRPNSSRLCLCRTKPSTIKYCWIVHYCPPIRFFILYHLYLGGSRKGAGGSRRLGSNTVFNFNMSCQIVTSGSFKTQNRIWQLSKIGVVVV